MVGGIDMAVKVCTSIWGTAWERYGEKFAKSFKEFWEPSIELYVTTSERYKIDNAQQVLLEDIPDYQTFLEKWRSHPVIPAQRVSAAEKFKYDALKWMPQAITPKTALMYNPHWENGDILIWTDADSEFYAPVTEDWIEEVLGGADVAALFRPHRHTEIGFFALRLNDKTRKMMKRFADLFISYDIFKYKEWHSAFAWDIALKEQPDIKIKNLNTKGGRGHVFPETILAEKIVHSKGELKGPYEGLI